MRNIIIVLLVATATALTNVPISTNNKPGQYLGQIQSLRILPDQLVFMLKDHSKFMYLNKIQGQTDMVVQIQDTEKVVEFNQYQIQLLEKGKMKSFDVQTKTLIVQRPLKNVKQFTFKEIVSYFLSPPQWRYLLTDKNIVRVPIIQKPGQQGKVQYIHNKTDQKGKTETYKQLVRVINFSKNEKNVTKREQQDYVLISEIKQNQNKQICMKKFDGKKSLHGSCFEVKKSSEYQMAKFRLGYFYISMSDMTYVVDQSLKVKSRIAKKMVSLSENVLVLQGGASFISSKNMVSEQLAFESQQNKIYKLLVQDGKVALVQSSELKKKPIAELEANKLKPINCWMNELNTQKSPEYELLIQWNDLSISFVHVGDEAKIVWRVEKASA